MFREIEAKKKVSHERKLTIARSHRDLSSDAGFRVQSANHYIIIQVVHCK